VTSHDAHRATAVDPASDPALLRGLLDTAVILANRAGEFLRDGVGRTRAQIETKSTGTDMVSEMDRGAERLLVEGILQARPDDGILGEEGTDRAGTTGVRWVIDPLDGTTNYLYGFPLWSVSIGVELHGAPTIGVVAAPMLGETFTAATGLGAHCNGEPIAVSECDDPTLALIGTGFGYTTERRAWQGSVAAAMVPRVRDLRRGGSAAIDLSFLACGRLDGFYERGLNRWDYSAGVVIIREAGGIVTDLNGTGEPTTEMLVAATPRIHGRLRSLVESAIHASPVPPA
jgi:myo-inositol-1(or 4)-monophosphatase